MLYPDILNPILLLVLKLSLILCLLFFNFE